MGWSGISTFVNPDDPLLDVILIPIFNELVIFNNNEGMYYPEEEINTLGEWNSYLGYIIKVTDTVSLTIDGEEVNDKNLMLDGGWTIMPVLTSNYDISVEALFAEVEAGFIIAKEVAGNGVYWNEYGINTIGNVVPGKSYHVDMLVPGSINFGIMPTDKAETPRRPEPVASPWNEVITSPSSHVIAIIPAGEILSKNDIIGGFTVNGSCAGYAQIRDTESPLALTVFGSTAYSDDPRGFETGEVISYRIYRPSTNETYELEVIYKPDMDLGNFETNGLSAATPVKLAPLGMLTLQSANINIYPNPNDGTFTIDGVEELVEMKIFNAFGEEIYLSGALLPTKITLTQPKGICIIKIITKKGEHYGKININ